MSISQDASDFMAKGDSAYSESRYDDALSYYNQAIEAEPGQAFALRNKGLALTRLGQYPEAIECFDAALGLDPDYVEAWIDKGGVHFQTQDFDAALACLDKAEALDEHEPDVRLARGQTLTQLERYPEAIDSLNTALELNPENVYVLNYVASVHSESGDPGRARSRYEEAIQVSDKILSGDPQNPQVWVGKGLSLRKLGRYTEAEECFRKAIDLEPKNPWWLFNLAGLYSEDLYYFERGAEFMLKALEVSPAADSYQLKLNYAENLIQIRQYEGAKEYLLGLSGQDQGADSPSECLRSFFLLCCDHLIHQSSDGFDEFIERLEGLGEDFEYSERRGYSFKGVTESIRSGDGDLMTKFLLLTLIEIMQDRLRRRDFLFFRDRLWAKERDQVTLG